MQTELDLNVQVAEPAHVQIERALRRQIQCGKLAPYQRLPSTNELVRQLGVSRNAIQRAMSALVKDGWIERKPMRGTFVKNPLRPALIGILFNPNLADENACFQRTVLQALRRNLSALNENAWQCRTYDGFHQLKFGRNIKNLPGYQDLIKDMKNYPFAGFIQLVGRDSRNKLNAVIKGVPTVRFGSPLDPAVDLALDYEEFGRSSVEYLAKLGLQRLAYFRVMRNITCDGMDTRGIQSAAARVKIPKVEICQTPDADRKTCLQELAYNSMCALMRKWDRRNNWPQGLIVSDDIAMYGVAMALAQKGVEVPGKMKVLMMANKGINLWYGIPVVRNEFSPDDLARGLVRMLSLRIHKKNLPARPVKVPCKL
ncbi:MAG: GntR family transcriptional regulator [Kiritimatiellae bacterium]|nr:GntR family transcriptional regulator [Kiritimatiellia bacterium]